MKTNGIHWFPLCIPPTPRQNLPSAGFLFLFLASSECAARPRLSMRLLHLAMMSCANPRKIPTKGVNLKEKEKKSKDQQRDILFTLLQYNAKNCHFSVLLRSLFQKYFRNFLWRSLNALYASLVYNNAPKVYIEIPACSLLDGQWEGS